MDASAAMAPAAYDVIVVGSGPLWGDKTLTMADGAKLRQGVRLGREILTRAGAHHLFQSHHFAAHPGGSVRIGAGVDS